MVDFTPTQGRYLAFIHAYSNLHGYPPAETEISAAIGVSAPSAHQMVKMLEKKGLIERQPGQARSIRVLVPEDEIPSWKHPRRANISTRANTPSSNQEPRPAESSVNLHVLKVTLTTGHSRKQFSNKSSNQGITRVIEIRGDQTLEQLHESIFQAYDRWEEHLYEFQFGKRPHDPDGFNYGHPASPPQKRGDGDASRATLDDLDLRVGRVFGYWFDFGDNWYHQVQVDRIEQAIPNVIYPRVIKSVGKSPPQYDNEDDDE